MPELIMVCGPNGAGKSTFTRTLAARQNIICIDTDALAANGLSPLAAGKASAKMTRELLSQGISFARESTLTAHFDFEVMEKAKAAGYVIRLVYIKLASPDDAIRRVRNRVLLGGHDVPAEDVVRRFHRSIENLPKAVAMADSYVILDNTGKGYVLVSQGEGS